jgi:hypothetical protein
MILACDRFLLPAFSPPLPESEGGQVFRAIDKLERQNTADSSPGLVDLPNDLVLCMSLMAFAVYSFAFTLKLIGAVESRTASQSPRRAPTGR